MKRTEFTQQWLDALRGGEFKQIKGRLHSTAGYCCLGVAAQVLGLLDREDSEKSYCAVRDSLGISRSEMWELMGHNDGFNNVTRKTFPEIADEIEKMLEPA